MKLLLAGLAVFTSLIPELTAQNYKFTGKGATNNWSNNENWKQGAQDPATDFPDNGANAQIENISGLLSAELSKSILLNLLQLEPAQQFSLNLNGNTLEVMSVEENGATSIFRDGTFIVKDSIDVENLRIVNTTFTFNSGGIYGGGLALWGNTTATNLGSTTASGSGLASGDASAKFVNKGTLTKDGAAAFNTMGVPYEQTGGQTIVKSGTLVFSRPATFSGGSITVDGESSAVSFTAPVNLGNVNVTLKQGGSATFFSSLTSNDVNVTAVDGGGDFIINSGNDAFSVSFFNGKSDAPVIMNSGVQDENVSSTNSGHFDWNGGKLDDFSNDGTMSIQGNGGSTTSRELGGLFSNSNKVTYNGSLTLNILSVFQNESNGEFLFSGGSIQPATGALEQSGFANLGTLESATNKGSINFSTRFLNQGEIKIGEGSVYVTGPGQFGGEVLLEPSDDASPVNAVFSVGGNSSVSHSIEGLTFKGLAPNGTMGFAKAEFGSGQYKLKGSLRSTSVGASPQVSVIAKLGTWITEDSTSLDFAEGLPFTLGTENFGPLFQVDKALNNVGHLEIIRVTVVGTDTFKNSGTINARRLMVGNNSSSGTFVNEDIFNIKDGASPFVEILGDSTFTNKGTINLVDNARIQSPFGLTEATFINEGSFNAIAPNRGKSINLIFKQKAAGNPEVQALSGNLSFNRKAEIEGGLVRSDTRIFLDDAVEWGNGGSPSMEFRDDGVIRFSASNKEFQLFNFLLASGQGSFELASGRMAPDEGLEGINFQDDAKLVIAGGILGSHSTRIDNFGNIEHDQGMLEGSMNSTGRYTMGPGGSIETYPVDDLSFSGEIGTFQNFGTFVWNGGSFAGIFKNFNPDPSGEAAMEIKGGLLREGSTLENQGYIGQTGALRIEPETTVKLVAGSLDLIDFASIRKTSGGQAGTKMQVDSGATLFGAAQAAARGGQSVNVDLFELNGGSVIAAKSALSISAAAIDLNGGAIELISEANLTLTGVVIGSRLNSLTVEEGCTFTVNDPALTPVLDVTNLNNKGTINANVVQGGVLDSLSEDEAISSTEPGTINGDLTQTPGDDLKTVVRTDGTDTSTVNVTGEASIDGPLYIIGENLGEGSVVPVLNAGSLVGTFSGDPIIVSTNPGLTGSYTYTAGGDVIVTISEDTSNNEPTETYQNFVYSTFPAELRELTTLWIPTLDADQDGLTNFEEFLLGTNPLDGKGGQQLLHRFDLVTNDCDGCDPTHLYPEVTLNSGENYQGVEFKFIKKNSDLTDSTNDIEMPAVESITPADGVEPKRRVLRGEDPINGEDKGFFEVDIELDEGETII